MIARTHCMFELKLYNVERSLCKPFQILYSQIKLILDPNLDLTFWVLLKLMHKVCLSKYLVKLPP